MAVRGAERLPGGIVRFDTDDGPLELPEGAPGVSDALAMAGPAMSPAPAPPEGRLADASTAFETLGARYDAPGIIASAPDARTAFETLAARYDAPPPAMAPAGSRIINPLAPQGGAGAPAVAPPPWMQFLQPQGGGGRAGVIPGQLQEKQRTTEHGIELPQEVRDLQGRSEQALRAAGATDIEVAKEKAAIQGQWQSELEDVHTDFRIQQQQREAERQRKVQGVLAQRDKAIDEFTNAKINPDRYWQNKSTFSKILSGIAITLSGGLSQRYGGPNEALEAVKEGMKVDIEAQRDEHKAKGARAEALNTVYSQMLDQFKREDLAAEASYQFGLEQMKRELDARLQSGGIRDKEIEAQGLRAMAQIDSDILQSRIKFEQLTQDHVTSTEVRTPDRVVGGPGAGDPLKRLERAAKAKELYEKLGVTPPSANPELQVGSLGQVADKTDAHKARDELASYLATKDQFKKAREILARGTVARGVGGFGPETEEYTEAKTVTSKLVTGVAKSYGGVIQASDRAAAQEETPDLTRWTGNQDVKLQTAEDLLDRNFAARMAAYGLSVPAASAKPTTFKPR